MGTRRSHHGDGDERAYCRWEKNGKYCRNAEVDGLEYCVFHVPDEDLEEAEDISGVQRCRWKYGEPDACRRQAVKNAQIIRCNQHGANAGSLTRTVAIQNTIEGTVSGRLAEVMQLNGEKLMRPDPIADPFTELMSTVAEVRALKDILRDQVIELMAKRQLRYESKAAGEQLRVEVLLYERAIERLMKGLADVTKLGIEDRLVAIREAQLRMLEHALDQALEASGVGLEGKVTARKTFRANLKVIKGELAG